VYYPSPAVILIKSMISHIKKVKKLYTNFTFCFSFWDFVPQTPYRGFAPGLHCGTSVPQTSWFGPHHVNPSIVKSVARLCSIVRKIRKNKDRSCSSQRNSFPNSLTTKSNRRESVQVRPTVFVDFYVPRLISGEIFCRNYRRQQLTNALMD